MTASSANLEDTILEFYIFIPVTAWSNILEVITEPSANFYEVTEEFYILDEVTPKS